MRSVPTSSSSPGGRETRWSAKPSFHSNTRLCFPGNRDPQNRVAIGEQSSWGTVKSIFLLCQSRSCACGRHRRQHGVVGWMEGERGLQPGCRTQMLLLTRSCTRPPQPPHFAQQSAQQNNIVHFYLQLSSSFANFIVGYHSYVSIFNTTSYIFCASFWETYAFVTAALTAEDQTFLSAFSSQFEQHTTGRLSEGQKPEFRFKLSLSQKSLLQEEDHNKLVPGIQTDVGPDFDINSLIHCPVVNGVDPDCFINTWLAVI